MKKLIFSIALLFLAIGTFAQGLEGIVVEKYYVSLPADSTGSANNGGGNLPAGSITWRVWADLAPGYTFQALYGVPGHNLVITSTTIFFNDENFGQAGPTMSATNIRRNAALLDSYLSAGGVASGNVGVFKTEDTNGSPGNNTTGGAILQNNDASTTGPINIGSTASLLANDGMIPGSPVSVTFVPAPPPIFDATQFGGTFTDNNFSAAALGGASGPTAANRVLIGQFTTNGIFHFELNLQLGTPSSGVENWVASAPVGSEQTHASLTGTFNQPNLPPTTSITSPLNAATFVAPAIVPVTAVANDPDGTIIQVELLVNSIPVETIPGNLGTYNFTPLNLGAGSYVLRSRATDNGLSVVTSAPINITVGNNLLPTVSITAPANGTPFVAPAIVPITASANDPDGTISQVEFFVSGVGSIGVDNSGPPWSINWTSGAPFGPRQITAVATDNNNATTTSAAVTITVSDPNALAYGIVSASATCVPSTFCQSVEARDTVDNVIGYDVVMQYQTSMVTPTGVVTVDNDLVNPAHVDAISSVDAVNGLIYISLSFNGSAPSGSEFNGTGNIFCVEFAKTPSFANVDTTTISIQTLQESYITGVSSVPADPGTYSTFRDTSFGGMLRYWFNNTAIAYNALVPSQHLITNIYGTDAACGNQSLVAVQPDINGDFVYDINNGEKIAIKKDIAAATSVQPVVNGFDAFLTRRVLINDLAFIPNVYQMVAMDVNTDGMISSGDLSQINQRTVLIYPEYRQDWNYDALGNPIVGAGPSKDWLFIDVTTVNSSTAYLISTSYPFDDGVGYSRARVPQIPFCLSLPNSSADTSGDCGILVSETYKAILLGDINGNFATVVPNSSFRANAVDQVVFDITKTVVGNGYVDVPVIVQYSSDVNALDFAMQSKLDVNSVVDHTGGSLESMANYNTNDKTFRFTSYSLQNIETGKPVISVRFNTTGEITAADLTSLEAYVNGERVGVDLGTGASEHMVTLFPNPATEMLNVVVSEDATVQLVDISGSEVVASTLVYANQKHEINTANLASGVYMLKVYNDNFVSTKKVVVKK